MLAYYGTKISPNQTETQEGFLICRNVPIARTGTQDYLARELGMDGENVIHVNRHEEDVFDPAALASFEGKPVTDNHPPETVQPSNFAAYAKGHVQNVRRVGDNVVADLYINDPVLMDEVKNGTKREVSCGYMCTYVEDGDDYKQTQIRGNHVAVVPQGRAGHEVAIKDAAVQAEKGRKGMANLVKGILNAFGMAAKDAEPEEMAQLVDATAETLKAVPEEEPKEEPKEEPAEDVKVESVPKGDDLGTKLDELLKKVDRLEKLFAKEEKDEDPEEAVTIEAEEAGDQCGKDSMELLKNFRNVLNQIGDKETREKVSDAITKSLTGDTGTKLAQAREAEHKVDRIAEQRNLYAARNPHKKED